MRPVRAPARELTHRPWSRLIGGAVVAAALAVTLLVGRGDPSPRPAAAPRSTPAAPAATAAQAPKPRKRVALIGGNALQSARCAQWRRGTARERSAIVTTLQVVVGGPTPFGRANALPPGQATALFDRACSHSYARSFLLYELYTRASAFHDCTPPPKL